MKSDSPHIPVLSIEVLKNINLSKKMNILDGTFGCGGHSRLILDNFIRLKMFNITLFCSDRDKNSFDYFSKLMDDYPYFDIRFNNCKFSQWSNWLNKENYLDTILIDLGISSFQLDTPDRGFCFSYDGPLDMRMDQSQKITAYDIVNTMAESEIADLIYNYGEEKYARSIAKSIVKERIINPINSTSQLSLIISNAKKTRSKRHPATKTFQAFRIFVNNEIDELIKAINNALKLLVLSGRLLIITFNGLEVRVMRNYIRTLKTKNTLRLISKIKPTYEEIKLNFRSRSAMLFVFEVVPNSL